MPNQLSFDLEFRADQIQGLVNNSGTAYLIVSGTYTYDPIKGINYWQMDAEAHGCDIDRVALPASVTACIKPCPTPAPQQG
ncbi:MAG: hypothetical protein ABIN94_06405 [Ferruginibacter sp.]